MPTRVQHGGKVVDAAKEISIPATARAAMERSTKQAAALPTTHVADHQPYREPSARPHPALKHLTTANHVQEVFKKRK